MKIKGNVIRDNQASLDGGALFYETTDGQIKDNEITYNTASRQGGAIYFEDNSSTVIVGNFIANNTSAWEGGAFYSKESSPNLINNGIYNNTSATAGGAMYLEDFNSVLLNNTIANNYGTDKGGAMYLKLSSPTFYNTLIWNNLATQGSQIYLEDQFSDPNFYYCDLHGGFGSIFIESGSYNGKYENCISLNPLFQMPTFAQGSTYPASNGIWDLLTYSPCINTGDQEEVPLTIPDTDLDGKDRIIHGIIDIGALEALNDSIGASCTISSNITWAAETVHVTCDVTVLDNVTLSIAPGTKVIIDSLRKIIVQGTLKAEGSKSEPIIFTVSDTTGFSNNDIFQGGWAGIEFDNESINGEMYDNDSSVFKHCQFKYVKGRSVIHCIRFSKLRVDQCRFSNNSGSHSGGIFGYFANILVNNSLFEKNRSNELYPAEEINSLYFEFSSPIISNNRFLNNYGYTIRVHSCNGIQIRNNYIYNSIEGYGLLVYTSHNTRITGNRVFNSGYSGISAFKGSHYMANNICCNNDDNGISIGECDQSFIINNTSCNNGYGIGASSNVYVYNNIATGNHYDNIRYYEESHGSNNLTTDPEFRSPSGGARTAYDGSIADWTIKPISPAIDAGTPETGSTDLPETDIAGNPRVWNDLVDIGAYENQGTIPLITKQPSNIIACGGDTVMFQILATDTAFYQWKKDGYEISGANEAMLVFNGTALEDQGNYSCLVSNAFGTTESNPAYFLVNLKPEILTEPANSWLQKDKQALFRVDVTGSAPLSFQWQKDGMDIPGAISPELKILTPSYEHEGMFSCIISNTCGTSVSTPATVYIAPDICMVTVDEETGDNLIVWEKNSIAPISHFNLYRESTFSGIFDLIGTIPYNELSVFTDSSANPTIQAYLYKITGVDSSGIETDPDLCKTHKTIHLLATTNPETNSTQLDWDRYVGFEYGQYEIYRSDTTFFFSVIHSMSSSTSTWADPLPGEGVKFYRIAAVRQDTCYPTGNTKAGTGLYAHSLSNMDNNKLKTSIFNQEEQGSLLIYPNPMSDYSLIQFSNPSRERYTLSVRELSGKLVFSKDDIYTNHIKLERNDFNPGLYLIDVRGPEIFRGKLMIK